MVSSRKKTAENGIVANGGELLWAPKARYGLFAFPQFFINLFFEICEHFINMLHISPTLEHEKIGFHVFPNNHAKKDGAAQNDDCFHCFLLGPCSISPCTV